MTSPTLKADWPDSAYTVILSKALDAYGADLLAAKPSDYARFCGTAPARACWVAVISAMARYESGFDTNQTYTEKFKDSKGQYVISTGLLQVSLESCRAYGASATSTAELKLPEKNLECAVRILNRWVPKDGVIAAGSSGAWRGGARYWAVLRDKQTQIATRARVLTQ